MFGIRYTPFFALVFVSACSLSTPMFESATDYNGVASDYSDQIVVNAILRARDYAPINITTLSTITGSLNVQGTLGFTVPFGVGPGSRNQASPSIQATSSPTWSMAPLNTESFALGMLQPISPTYLVSKWNSGLDHELLLRLFVKSIRLADDKRTLLLNNPDSIAEMKSFAVYLDGVPEEKKEGMLRDESGNLKAVVTIKAFDVLEPIGPEYNPANIKSTVTTVAPFAVTATPASPAPTTDCLKPKPAAAIAAPALAPPPAVAAPPPATPTPEPACSKQTATTFPVTDPNASSVLAGLTFATQLSDGQYHFGNAGARDASGKYTRLQLYRDYPGQVALCAPLPGADLFGPAPYNRLNFSTGLAAQALMKAKGGGTGTGAGGGGMAASALSAPSSTSSSKSAGTSASTAGAAMGAMTVAMQANRLSAIVPVNTCLFDQLVLPSTTDREQDETDARTFAHIEWRSIEEVIQYLGAIVRNYDTNPWLTWTTDVKERNTVFTLEKGIPSGLVTTNYRGTLYSVPDQLVKVAGRPNDHSAQALSMVNELINVIKVSSDIPLTQQFQIIP